MESAGLLASPTGATFVTLMASSLVAKPGPRTMRTYFDDIRVGRLFAGFPPEQAAEEPVPVKKDPVKP